MFDAKRLLDALIGAAAQIGQSAGSPDGQAQPAAAPSPSAPAPAASPLAGLPPQVTDVVQRTTGQSPDQLLQAAKGVLQQHPGMVQAAAVGLAGLLFSGRNARRGMPSNLARLGGLAVIGGLAYKAWQNSKAGKPLLDVSAGGQSPAPAPGQTPAPGHAPPADPQPAAVAPSAPGAGEAPGETRTAFRALDVPQGSAFHPVSHTEDDALLFLRAMIAAAAADGRVDEAERARITRGLNEAGIDPAATRWLDEQMAAPADVEELAAGITNPEKAAQVYTAARIAIDPDTMQEREFLKRLAEALDLEEGLRAQIDDMASATKL